MSTAEQSPAATPFAFADFRYLLTATALATGASRALAVVLGYKVYELTHDPLSLGMLGLVEAIPSVSLALFGGHVADRVDRRSILRVTLAALAVCAMVLAVLEAVGAGEAELYLLYAVVFIAGIARGFAEPAASALEAQVVPWELLINCSTIMASVFLTAGTIGPLVGGVVYSFFGAAWTFVGIGLLYAAAWIPVHYLQPRPPLAAPHDETIWQSVSAGVRYVVSDQIMLASMALDLFAVLFGGAIDILHVGPVGLGVMNAAPMAGALMMMLWSTKHPPVDHAGRSLLIAVAGFGVTMIVFAFSRSIVLSVVMLFLSGVFDAVSVVVRRGIIRLMSPEALRGRIASVSMIFIGSSNELGALESGMAAKLLGTVPSVWMGGVVTLLIVAVAAVAAPKLRRLSLDPAKIPRQGGTGNELDDITDESAVNPPE